MLPPSIQVSVLPAGETVNSWVVIPRKCQKCWTHDTAFIKSMYKRCHRTRSCVFRIMNEASCCLQYLWLGFLIVQCRQLMQGVTQIVMILRRSTELVKMNYVFKVLSFYMPWTQILTAHILHHLRIPISLTATEWTAMKNHRNIQ